MPTRVSLPTLMVLALLNCGSSAQEFIEKEQKNTIDPYLALAAVGKRTTGPLVIPSFVMLLVTPPLC